MKKWLQYLFVKEVFQSWKKHNSNREKAHSTALHSDIIPFEKGYWKFNRQLNEYSEHLPKKDIHYVTTFGNDKELLVEISISKNPKNLSSEKFDYPWDAEDYASLIVALAVKRGYDIFATREVHVKIVDQDICCPHCFNSNRFKNWVQSSYIFENKEPPEHLIRLSDRELYKMDSYLELIETEYYWCPICTAGTKNAIDLLLKGDEWKVPLLIKNPVIKVPSSYALKVRSEIEHQKKKTPTEQLAQLKNSYKPILSISDFPKYSNGLIIRCLKENKTNNAIIRKHVWYDASKLQHYSAVTPLCTSLKAKINTASFPRSASKPKIYYVPIEKIELNEWRLKYIDDEQLNQCKVRFFNGESVPPLVLSRSGEAISNIETLILCYELGLTHCPVIFKCREWDILINIDQFKEHVEIIKNERGSRQMISESVKAVAKGTFIKRNNTIFRTEAYIQWGNSDEVLGTVLMQNPGSATADISINENEERLGNLHIDPTIKHLIEILEKAYPQEKLIGRVYIYNLFSLRNGNGKSSIAEFNELWARDEPLVKGFPKPRDELIKTLQQSQWVLLGWGCGNTNLNLNTLKLQWLDLINEADTVIIGKKGNRALDYHHPRPQLQSSQKEYKSFIVTQLKELLSSNDNHSTPPSKEMVDQSWLRHVNYYEPLHSISIGNYIVILYELNETGRAINYIYRLMIFTEHQTSPIMTFNFEKSFAGTSCLAVTRITDRINLADAPPDLTIQEFTEWLRGVIPDFIPDLNIHLLSSASPITNTSSNTNVLQQRRMQKFIQNIREFADRFEYLFISNYENLEFEEIHAIQLQDANVVLIESKEKMSLASIEMSKKFTLEQFYYWLQTHAVYVKAINQVPHIIKGCASIKAGVQLKGNLVVTYEKGKNDLQIDQSEFEEIMGNWLPSRQIIDSTKVAVTQAIMLNGRKVEQFEPMYFELTKDLIISNGNQVNANCIKMLNSHIAFFRPEFPEPIALIATNKTIIDINTYPTSKGSTLCTIEFNYLLDVETK